MLVAVSGIMHMSHYVLIDSGADEHVCPVDFMTSVPLHKSTGGIMHDAQGNCIPEQGTRDVFLRLARGRIAKVTFRVANVKNPILSLGRLIREGFDFALRGGSCIMSRGGEGIALEIHRNSTWLRAEAFATAAEAKASSIAPLLDVGTQAAPDVGEQAASPAAVDPPAVPFGVTVEVRSPKGCLTPFLRSWSPILDMQNRCKELGAATYGSKDVMWKRLVEYELVRQNKERERTMLEARREELALMVDPVAPKLLAGPAAPTDEERRIHEATHLPPQPWCEWCVLGRGAATQHAKKQDIHSIPVIAM